MMNRQPKDSQKTAENVTFQEKHRSSINQVRFYYEHHCQLPSYPCCAIAYVDLGVIFKVGFPDVCPREMTEGHILATLEEEFGVE